MAEQGNIFVIIIGYILAILESFPLGLIFGILLYVIKSDNEYYRQHAKYMIIISIILTVIIFVFFGGMILSLMGMSASSSSSAPV